MNRIHRGLCATLGLLLAALLLASCAGPSGNTTGEARFHETAAADVVIRHYRWEHLNLIKPNYREGGFLIQVSRDSLGPTFDRLRVNRRLAVVVLGWNYSDDDLQKLVAEWKILLRGLGFEQVVSVRATGQGDDVDGALIVDDTRQTDATSKKAAGN